MNNLKTLVAAVSFVMLMTCTSFAHFGMVIPSDNMVMPDENRTIQMKLSFSHPFEMIGMQCEAPAVFTVEAPKKQIDLTGQLKNIKVMDHDAWQTDFSIKRPGAYVFAMTPKPYWEPAEDCFIVHYTKTVVAAFGDDIGWDRELGLKTEIVPLSKPFGLYAGNVFQGIVKLYGKPVPYAEIEVEYYNKDKKAQAPTDYMVAQTIRADGNGVFTYAAPKSGWWGFAALSTDSEKMKYKGEDKDVEIGAVIWVKFEEWQENN